MPAAEPAGVAGPPGHTCGGCGARLGHAARFCFMCGMPVAQDEGAHRFVDPLVGVVIADRYRVVARIGAGGMGVVYRVEHVQLGKVAAMKLLRAELSRDPQMLRRFSREARAVSRLTSPHTVSVFDFGRSGGFVFIVMELLTGQDLATILASDGPLDPARVANLVEQVAESLTEAHELGIVHRDLKPQNIFVVEGPPTAREQVKVLDFGLAKAAESREESIEVTQAGVVMGTPHYMAPEQIREHTVDPRSDVYSLAAVVFRLLTGRPVFEGQTPLSVLHMHAHEAPRRLSDVRAELEPLDAVIGKALSKEPERRPQSVALFAEEFSRAAALMGDSTRSSRRVTAGAGVIADAARLGTRHEFEEFERRLKWRRGAAAAAGSVAAAAAVVGLALSVVPKPRLAQEEHEPNEDLAHATSVSTTSRLAGVVAPPPGSLVDVDTFRFALVDTPAVFGAEVAAMDGVDVVLRVVDGLGRVLAESDGAGSDGGERIDGVAVASAEVFVSVRAMRTTLDGVPPRYTLVGRARPPFPDEEVEPNGSAPQHLSGRAVGRIGTPGDVDRFELPSGDAGGNYRIRLSGVPGMDLQWQISDLAGTRGDTVDRGGLGAPETATVRVGRDEFVGVPFVEVRAADGAQGSLTYELVIETVGGRDGS